MLSFIIVNYVIISEMTGGYREQYLKLKVVPAGRVGHNKNVLTLIPAGPALTP